MTLDTGVRFFDNALTLGTIIKYTGKARRLSPDFEQDEHTGAIIKQDLPQIPTIIDLYGTYEYNRNLTLKLSVQNLMNRDYSEALNKLNMMPGLGDETHPANSARGRTWIFGGDISFLMTISARFRQYVFSLMSILLQERKMNIFTLSKAPLYLLISLFLPTMAMAIDPPERELSRFALKTNYLQSPDEGVYELAFDNASKKVFAAVTDRVNREANKHHVLFNSDSLKVENKYTMPYRAFSLAINQDKHQLYIGHTQSASLRISMFDTPTGKLVRTSDRLSFKAANAADSRFEHFRHMVYSQDSDTLFVSYSNMLKTAEGMKPLHKLLMLDGTTLALKGEVKDAYKGTAYGLTMDEKHRKSTLAEEITSTKLMRKIRRCCVPSR